MPAAGWRQSAVVQLVVMKKAVTVGIAWGLLSLAAAAAAAAALAVAVGIGIKTT